MFDGIPIIDLFFDWLPADIIAVMVTVIVVLLALAIKRMVMK